MNPISTPLASKKLTKRIFKCAKKASKEKTDGLRRGVKVFISLFFLVFKTLIKDVLKFIKKGEKGLAVLAGDTYPIDVYRFDSLSFPFRKIPTFICSIVACSWERDFFINLCRQFPTYLTRYIT